MNRIKSVINKILGGICAVILAFMTILVTYQVVMRYVFKNPSTISEDLLSYLFVWVSLLGTALVFGERDHMRLSFFSDKLKGIWQLALSVFSELLIMTITAGVFLLGGKGFMEVGATQISPTMNISMDWIYMVLPMSGVLIVVYNVVNIVQMIQKFNESGSIQNFNESQKEELV